MSEPNSLSNGGSIAAGLFLVVIAGCLNGSWNASFSPTHGHAVGRQKQQQQQQQQQSPSSLKATSTTVPPVDLSYHLAWILFQIYSAIINIPICLFWAGGPTRVRYIVQGSSGMEIAMVCIFSVLWGVGSVGFGLACKVAGVGLGTNLCMGVIMVLGTFLPLCLDGAIATPAGGMVVAGLLVCCLGLASSVQSLQLRDVEEREHKLRRRTMHNTTVSTDPPQAPSTIKQGTIDEKDSPVEETAAATHPDVIELSKDCLNKNEVKRTPPKDCNDDDDDDEPSTLRKVTVCVIAGIFATQLQFAFVFGDEMIALAEDATNGPGFTPPSGTSAVIWLFAISLGAPVSIVYGLYNNSSNVPLSTLYQCPWYRHVLILLTTSIPWVSHIHLYGYSNTFLPAELAASVAWPILMMMTVVAGMLWSIGLGEWNVASNSAKWKLYRGLFLVTLGVGVIMASVAS